MASILTFVSLLLIPILSSRGKEDTSIALTASDYWDQIVPSEQQLRRSHNAKCRGPPLELVEKANLTEKEREVLPLICWGGGNAALAKASHPVRQTRKGIPQGVTCSPTDWCDSDGMCTEVCARGTVVIEPWLQNAISTQAELARRLPLCYAALLGTHNSAITLADGFGNRDEYFQQYFKWIKWVSGDDVLRTNDQYLSLTDQLNLGVRAVELDVHWVEGELRIAHCGGFHAAPFNALVRAVNVIASLLGHPIHWDTETVGCEPSLSSLPVRDQRPFSAALAELAAWLAAPGNEREFLVVFLDDQRDIATWGFLPLLLIQIREAFPPGSIYTPPEHEAAQQLQNGSWPSIDELLGTGKRLIFVSGVDYGPDMATLLFERRSGTVCGWQEPPLAHFEAAPACDFDLGPPAHVHGNTLNGTLFRVTTCELLYGPLNCGFMWKSDNMPVLDELSLPAAAACSVNMPCPDLLTPERSAAAIWSWAPGHPFGVPDALQARERRSSGPMLAQAWRWLQRLLWGHAVPQDMEREASGKDGKESSRMCAVASATDGRWRAAECGAKTGAPSACRGRDGAWRIAGQQDAGGELWAQRGACPEGAAWEVPQHGKDNLALEGALLAAGAHTAWLPIEGPEWRLPGAAAHTVAATV